MSRLREWVDGRVGLSRLADYGRHHRIPASPHTPWYLLGGLCLFLFALQVITGVLLGFYYEPGRIWVEHGCQYDPECSFEFPLRKRLALLPEAIHKAEKDLPLGTFFQRYLYNGFGNITFIVPNSKSNFRYLRWLILNRPRLLARVLRSQVPFLLQFVLVFEGLLWLERCHHRKDRYLWVYLECQVEHYHAVLSEAACQGKLARVFFTGLFDNAYRFLYFWVHGCLENRQI